MITTEGILTSAMGFGLDTATPVQRASCRIGDGLPLDELRDDLDVIKALGGREAIRALPSERGLAPTEFIDVSSPRTAKTMRSVARTIRLALAPVVELGGLKVGEVPRVVFCSLTLDTAAVPFRMISTLLTTSPAFKPLVMAVTGDSIEVRHPSGRIVEIKMVAGSRAAGNLMARWLIGAVFDEATRMLGADESVTNLPDALSATRERLLPGGQVMLIGQPWQPYGPAYDAFQQYFGHPTDEVVAMRSTGPAANPGYWTRQRLDKLWKRDEAAARVAEFAEFLSQESNLYSATVVDAATRSAPLVRPPSDAYEYVAAMDPGTRSNAWTLVVVGKPKLTKFNETAHYVVVLTKEWVGSKFRPLKTDDTFREIGYAVKPYGITSIISDQWSFDALRSAARRVQLDLVERNLAGAKRVAIYENARVLLENGRLELPPHAQLRDDLLHVKKRITQAGVSIELPKVGNRHCDFAPALCLALDSAYFNWAAANESSLSADAVSDCILMGEIDPAPPPGVSYQPGQDWRPVWARS